MISLLKLKKQQVQTQNSQGYAQGLYADDQLDSNQYCDRDRKLIFLHKIIDYTSRVLGEEIEAKPVDIVAGKTPEKTNLLLQAIFRAAVNGKNSYQFAKDVCNSKELYLIRYNAVVQQINSMYQKELFPDQWRQQFEDLQQQFVNLKSHFEKEHLIWKGELELLQEQNKLIKVNLKDTLGQCDLLQNVLLQQQKDEERKNTISEKLIALEEKYQEDIPDVTEHHQALIAEYQARINLLTAELSTNCQNQLKVLKNTSNENNCPMNQQFP